MHYLASFTAPQLYKLSFTTAPVVTLTGSARSLRDWMKTYVHPVAELTSFATGKPQPVTFASVKIGGRNESSVYGRELTQQRYEAERPRPGALQALVHCGPGSASLTELIAGWGDLKDRYVTFADYFTSISTTPLPVTSRFIALVAALESFHGVDDSATPNSSCGNGSKPSPTGCPTRFGDQSRMRWTRFPSYCRAFFSSRGMSGTSWVKRATTSLTATFAKPTSS